MEKTDGLSRRLDQKVGVEKNNKNQTLIKEQQICILAEIVIEGPEVDIIEKILRGDEWQIERKLVLKKRKVYMLKDEKLRVEIIWLHHNVLVAGHRKR